MPNKLLVITETKHSDYTTVGPESMSPKFWHQLPRNKTHTDQKIRAAWYNIDLDTWNPSILTGPPNSGQLVGTHSYQIIYKIPSPRPIVMFEQDHPEYLKRQQYCLEVNITITTELINVDGNWTP